MCNYLYIDCKSPVGGTHDKQWTRWPSARLCGIDRAKKKFKSRSLARPGLFLEMPICGPRNSDHGRLEVMGVSIRPSQPNVNRKKNFFEISLGTGRGSEPTFPPVAPTRRYRLPGRPAIMHVLACVADQHLPLPQIAAQHHH